MKNPINSLDYIYQELGANVCLYPFFNSFYQTNHVDDQKETPNSIRPCSIILDRDNPRVWDISSNIADTRNNDNWKDIRRTFIEGSVHDVAACSACSFNERSGATSARQMNNQFYSEFLSVDIVDEVKTIIANNYTVSKLMSMDYYPSNYCNYSCIMCAGGASSKRHTFEIKYLGNTQTLKLNPADSDFYSLLDNIEVINLTGGETILQKQVEELIDYLIERDLAKNIIITLIANASSYPEKLLQKFKQFRDIFYTISIDGVGDVIEYQRRGADWSQVETNALKMFKEFGSIVNCVITGVNVFGVADFLTWAESHGIDKICISPVFRELHLSVDVIPDELKSQLINKLNIAKMNAGSKFVEYYDQIISLLNYSKHEPENLKKFIARIKVEDQVSKKTLSEVVPEWAPYFNE
jgi:MoaA/NifB/PqqE/SkfB family radical SAM enzyme